MTAPYQLRCLKCKWKANRKKFPYVDSKIETCPKCGGECAILDRGMSDAFNKRFKDRK